MKEVIVIKDCVAREKFFNTTQGAFITFTYEVKNFAFLSFFKILGMKSYPVIFILASKYSYNFILTNIK